MEKGEKVLGALIRETCQNVYKIETVFFHLKIGLSTVPELRSRYGKLDRYTKLRYTNRTAPVQRPFLLAGELASLAAEF